MIKMKITIFKKSLHQKASNPKFVWAKDTKFTKQKLIELTGKHTNPKLYLEI